MKFSNSFIWLASLFEFFRRHLQGVPARHERGEGDGKFQKRVKKVGHAAFQHGGTGPVLSFQAKVLFSGTLPHEATATPSMRDAPIK